MKKFLVMLLAAGLFTTVTTVANAGEQTVPPQKPACASCPAPQKCESPNKAKPANCNCCKKDCKCGDCGKCTPNKKDCKCQPKKGDKCPPKKPEAKKSK